MQRRSSIYGEPLEAQGAQDTAWAQGGPHAQEPADDSADAPAMSLADTVTDDAGYVFRVEGSGHTFVLVGIPNGKPGSVGAEITPQATDAWQKLTYNWLGSGQDIEPTVAAPAANITESITRQPNDVPDTWTSQANDLMNSATEGLATVQGMMSAGYAQFFGGGFQEKNTNADASKSAAQSRQAEEETAPTSHEWEDGFDEAAAQAHMEDMYDRYTRIEVGGVTASTTYRNTGGEEYGGAFHDAVYEGHGSADDASAQHLAEREADLFVNDPDTYYALLGKGSPEQIEHAVQTAYENGMINGKRPGEGEPLTKEEVEAWMKGNVGVDCIGYVMNTHIRSEDFSTFGPESDSARDENYTRVLGFNTHDFDEITSEVSAPSQWRAMDVIHWEAGKSGHVMMVYSNEQVSEDPPIFEVTVHESAASAGPIERTYDYDSRRGSWKKANNQYAPARTPQALGQLMDAHIPSASTVRRVPTGDAASGDT